jgi:hypothetical protein
LAEYNAGITTVDRYAGVPPFPETCRHLERIERATGLETRPTQRIYQTEDIVDGRRVIRLSNLPPPASSQSR